MKKLTIILLIALIKNSYAQQNHRDIIYTDATAIVSITIKDTIPLGKFVSVNEYMSYSIYKISVDSVYYIRVYEDFATIFDEKYLLSCMYMVVPFVKWNDTKQKNDWNIHKKYRIEVDVGYGKKDLTFYGIIQKGIYVPRSKISAIQCSFYLGCHENNKECEKRRTFFEDIIEKYK